MTWTLRGRPRNRGGKVPTGGPVSVPPLLVFPEHAADRQLLLAIYAQVHHNASALSHQGVLMADLTTAVADLTAAVAAVETRLSGDTGGLQAALADAADAHAKLTEALAADTTDKATIDTLTAEVAAANDRASTAANAIETSVTELGHIGASSPPASEPAPATDPAVPAPELAPTPEPAPADVPPAPADAPPAS